MLAQKIGMIGAGQMATALARGLLNAGLVKAEGLLASDPSPEARKRFGEATGGIATEDNLRVAREADVVFLAVKPQQVAPVLAELAGVLGAEKLVVSIAAGVTLRRLCAGLGEQARLVRVMPNTPCLVGQGASAYCLGPNATEEDARLVERLLGAVGVVCRVEEKLMDAVTGLSGSGPAFVYVIIEAMSDAGVKVGLPRQVAIRLAAQTVLGAAKMVLQTGEHPGVLKDRVASPGGTTIAGLSVLERGALRGTLIAAVEAATQRSAELGTPAPNQKNQ